MTVDLSVSSWLDAVASRKPTPGGGAVAAHLGAQSSALFAMVCRYSKKGDFGPAFITALDASTQRFLELGAADEKAYETLIKTLKHERQHSNDPAALNAAYCAAAEPPLMIFDLAAKLSRQFHTVQATLNQNLASDTAMVALMLECTLNCAELNIQINLNLCHDPALKTPLTDRLDSHSPTRQALAQTIANNGAS